MEVVFPLRTHYILRDWKRSGWGEASQQRPRALCPHTNNCRKSNPARLWTGTLSSQGTSAPGLHRTVHLCAHETHKAGLCGLVSFVLLAIETLANSGFLSYETIEHHTWKLHLTSCSQDVVGKPYFLSASVTKAQPFRRTLWSCSCWNGPRGRVYEK